MLKKEIRESIVFENHHQKLFGIIHRPNKTDSKLPAVVFCHGFGGNKSGKNQLYVHIAEALSTLGIISFRFDFRGSGDSGGAFSEMTIEGEVSDALKAYQLISQDSQVDPSRIGFLGKSLGGLVAVLATSKLKTVKSMVLLAPVFSAHQWIEKASQHEGMSINGIPTNENLLMQFLNVKMEEELCNLKEIPMLHIHGEMDPVILISHADLYAECRKNVPAETKIIRLPHSDHDFTNENERNELIMQACSWFQKTL